MTLQRRKRWARSKISRGPLLVVTNRTTSWQAWASCTRLNSLSAKSSKISVSSNNVCFLKRSLSNMIELWKRSVNSSFTVYPKKKNKIAMHRPLDELTTETMLQTSKRFKLVNKLIINLILRMLVKILTNRMLTTMIWLCKKSMMVSLKVRSLTKSTGYSTRNFVKTQKLTNKFITKKLRCTHFFPNLTRKS